jgi:hypothetical protein
MGNVTMFEKIIDKVRGVFVTKRAERLRLIVAGTDLRQVGKAFDLSFGLIIEGGGERVFLDPGPDAVKQAGDAEPIDVVVITHDDEHTGAGVEALKQAGFAGVVRSEVNGTLVEGVTFQAAGAKWKAIGVKHEPGVKTLGFDVQAGDHCLGLYPHAKAIPQDSNADVLVVGVGGTDMLNPEYMIKTAMADQGRLVYVAGYCQEASREDVMAGADDNTIPLSTGDGLVVYDEELEFHPAEAEEGEGDAE